MERMPTVRCVLIAVAAGERSRTAGRIVQARGIALERYITNCRVLGAGGIGTERLIAGRSIIAAVGIAEECLKAQSGVAGSPVKELKGEIALGGVATGIASVRWWVNRPQCRRQRKTGQGAYAK